MDVTDGRQEPHVLVQSGSDNLCRGGISLADNDNLCPASEEISLAENEPQYSQCLNQQDGTSLAAEDNNINWTQLDFDSNCIVTPVDDDKYVWTPVCEDGKRPYIGMVFREVEDAYIFYKQYGKFCGFDVRRGTESKHSDGTILRKHVYCSKNGGGENHNVDTLHTNKSGTKRKRLSRRTHCGACIKLKFDGPGRYIVSNFIECHNHAMSSDVCSQFLKSRRELSVAHKSLIVQCSRVNIGPVRAYNLSSQLAGGYENVGAQKPEFKNFSRDIVAYIGDADAQMVIDKLSHKKKMQSEFFFEYTEENGVLTRLFWADPISRRNYHAFGDVVSFDATYGTNK